MCVCVCVCEYFHKDEYRFIISIHNDTYVYSIILPLEVENEIDSLKEDSVLCVGVLDLFGLIWFLCSV